MAVRNDINCHTCFCRDNARIMFFSALSSSPIPPRDSPRRKTKTLGIAKLFCAADTRKKQKNKLLYFAQRLFFANVLRDTESCRLRHDNARVNFFND